MPQFFVQTAEEKRHYVVGAGWICCQPETRHTRETRNARLLRAGYGPYPLKLVLLWPIGFLQNSRKTRSMHLVLHEKRYR